MFLRTDGDCSVLSNFLLPEWCVVGPRRNLIMSTFFASQGRKFPACSPGFCGYISWRLIIKAISRFFGSIKIKDKRLPTAYHVFFDQKLVTRSTGSFIRRKPFGQMKNELVFPDGKSVARRTVLKLNRMNYCIRNDWLHCLFKWY